MKRRAAVVGLLLVPAVSVVGCGPNKTLPPAIAAILADLLGAGDAHCVAVTSAGTVVAWGDGGSGQLGNGATGDSAVPVPVTGLTNVRHVAGGEGHSLAVRTDGTVFGWGNNSSGQVGDGTSENNRLEPVQVVGPGGVGFLTGAVDAAAGSSFSVVARNDGTAWTWGFGQDGRLGNGTNTVIQPRPVQVTGLTDVIQVAAGVEHGVALRRDGTVWTWGQNGSGQLGNGTTDGSNVPVQVVGPGGVGFLTGIVDIGTTSRGTLAIRNDGTMWAWGRNGDGELGDGTPAGAELTPVQAVGPGGVGFMTGVVSVDGGDHHSIIARADGTVWGFGRNSDGQLGNGTNNDSSTPVQVVGVGGAGFLTGIRAVSVGSDGFTSYAIRPDGAVFSWGSGGQGRLGNGTSPNSQTTPVQVTGLPV